MAEKEKISYKGAFLVAVGILFSRLAGLIRLRALAHFLGDSDAADAFYAAVKIPNFPQNLFGEGVLSASFIPVYANLLAKGDREQANKVASIILSLLTLVISIIVAVGIMLTPLFIDVIAPGFTGEKRNLTIRLVQIIFPGTGLLVISAWCLGVLNSHHKFFLSYSAPVLWNAAIIAALIFHPHGSTESQLALIAAWGLVAGSVLQLGVQVPTAVSLVPKLHIDFSLRLESVRDVIRNFSTVVIGRGVVQFSAYIDNILASFLPSGAVSVLGYAQSIYMLPISLFGMSISAAELPSMSHGFGSENHAETLRARIDSGLKQVALFVVPSAAGFLILGDVIASLLFQTGKFGPETTKYVWAVLVGSAVGLLASTQGRLYSSAFYSLRDTKTPLRFSIIRVSLTTVLGYVMGLKAPGWIGISPEWGTAGLTGSAGLAGWVEFLLLQRSLNRQIGKSGLPFSTLAKLWVASVVAGLFGLAVKLGFSVHHPVLRGVTVIAAFGVVYFPVAAAFGVPEARAWLRKVYGKLRT